jgi:hypothetical protein
MPKHAHIDDATGKIATSIIPASSTLPGGGTTSQSLTKVNNDDYNFEWTTVSAGGGYTDEEAQDAVGNIMSGAGSVTVTYDDAGGAITISGAGASVAGADHSDLSNLDYASAGHTGFQPAGDYITETTMTTISGDIVSQMASATFNKDTIPDLVRWWKADALILNDNDLVASWTDSSDTGDDATAASTDRPTYKTNIINGHPVVRFNGTNTMAFTELTDIKTVFIVSAKDNVTNNNVLLGHSSNGSSYIADSYGGSTRDYATANGVSAYGGKDTGATIFHTTTTHILYVNGGYFMRVLSFGVAGAWVDQGISTFGLDRIGDYTSGTTYDFDGDIAEILIYNRSLSDFERAQIEGYLNAKYNVENYIYADGTITGFTSELAQDAVGTIMTGAGSVTVVYDDAGGTITVSGAGASVAGADHSTLANLSYAAAGHTGFQPAGDYITETTMTTISGDIVGQIPSLAGYATDSEVTTISGDIVAQIPSVATFIEASDVTYENLSANSDIGTSSTQVAQGDHTHTGLVTNGDTHDHNGGDGAQIAYSSLGSIPSTFAPASHNNDAHSVTYIAASGVTYENLSANSDIGTGSTQVSQGDHTHSYLASSAFSGLAKITVGTTEPSTPSTGDLWVDTN